jgi:uncharacterized membrane protein
MKKKKDTVVQPVDKAIDLKDKNLTKSDRRILSMIRTESFSGPLPHPSIFQSYEQICPGAANRIIKIMEKQVGHRQNIENKVVSSNIKNERTGMFLAFTLTIITMIVGAVLLIIGKEVAGYISLFTPGAFQAGNYVYKKYYESTESKTDESKKVKEEKETKQKNTNKKKYKKKKKKK